MWPCALAGGSQVNVFLTLESVRLGTPTGAAGLSPRGFSESLDQYVEHFLDLGGTLEVCSSCYEEYCRSLPTDMQGQTALRPGTNIRSLGVVAERALIMPVVSF